MTFVQPLAAKLQDSNGGREFLVIAAELVSQTRRSIDPEEPLGLLIFDRHRSGERWARLIEPLMPAGTTGAPLHRRFSAVRFVYTELGRRAESPRDSDHKLFTSHLVDLMAALLSAPISDVTRSMLHD
jgi:hypothetical protein